MTYRQIGRPRVVIWPDGTAQSRLDLSAIVESFTTSKSLAAPAGSWSMRLLPHLVGRSRSLLDWSDLERVIRPNAVVSIGFDVPGGVMLGLVDSVRRSRTWGGSVSDTLELQGSDFGKLLVNDSIVTAALTVRDYAKFVEAIDLVAPGNALTNQLPGAWGPNREDGGHAFVQATVREVAEWILKTTTAVRIPMLAGLGSGETSRVGDFMVAEVPSSWNDGRVQSENLWSYQGTVWGFLNEIIDPDFYEVFVDSRAVEASTRRGDVITKGPSGQRLAWSAVPEVVLTMRPKPFDESGLQFLPTTERTELTWDALRTSMFDNQHHQIANDEVFTESMGVSDAEVYSYYLVTSAFDLMGNPQAAAEGLLFPAIDLFGLQRHGVRAYQARLSLLASDVLGKEQGDAAYTRRIGSEVLEFRNRLFNWYRLNEYMESGSITVRGRDEFRVGEPVYLPWKFPLRGGQSPANRHARGMRYYCVATQHSWQYGQPYTTTLSLTRGHNQALIDQASYEIGQLGTTYGMPGMKVAT